VGLFSESYNEIARSRTNRILTAGGRAILKTTRGREIGQRRLPLSRLSRRNERIAQGTLGFTKRQPEDSGKLGSTSTGQEPVLGGIAISRTLVTLWGIPFCRGLIRERAMPVARALYTL
jgi:hypothetical protein